MCTRFYNKKIEYINKKGEKIIYNNKCKATSKRCNSICDIVIEEFIKQYKDGLDLDNYIKCHNFAIKSFKDHFILYIMKNKLI